MQVYGERVVTRLLLAACVVCGAVVMVPRVGSARGRLEVVQPPITVEVRGDVVAPGLYTLPFGARADDLVTAAGGPPPAAALSLVSLSDPLTDGESLFVPGRAAADGRGERVSLNSASSAELDTLPGVGPVVAAKIIAHRPYASIDDVLKVPGIGPKTLERLRPLVTL